MGQEVATASNLHGPSLLLLESVHQVQLHGFCAGSVIVDRLHPAYIGASVRSSDAAELSAMHWAQLDAIAAGFQVTVILHTDATLRIGMTVQGNIPQDQR